MQENDFKDLPIAIIYGFRVVVLVVLASFYTIYKIFTIFVA